MTQEDLARDLAERNERCGHVEGADICLRPKDHSGPHQTEPIRKVIPIQ